MAPCPIGGRFGTLPKYGDGVLALFVCDPTAITLNISVPLEPVIAGVIMLGFELITL
jgi:hypothetical protein